MQSYQMPTNFNSEHHYWLANTCSLFYSGYLWQIIQQAWYA